MTLAETLRQAQEAFDRRQFDLAEQFAWQAMHDGERKTRDKQLQSRMDALSLLTRIYDATDNHHGAAELGNYLLGQKEFPQLAGLTCLLDAYTNLGDYDKAAEYIRRFERIAGRTQALERRVCLALCAERYDEARQYLDELLTPGRIAEMLSDTPLRSGNMTIHLGDESTRLPLMNLHKFMGIVIGHFGRAERYDDAYQTIARFIDAIIGSMVDGVAPVIEAFTHNPSKPALQLFEDLALDPLPGHLDAFRRAYWLCQLYFTTLETFKHIQDNPPAIDGSTARRTYRSQTNERYIKFGPPEVLAREMDVAKYFSETVRPLTGISLWRPAEYTTVRTRMDRIAAIMSSHAGEPFEDALDMAFRDRAIIGRWPTVMLEQNEDGAQMRAEMLEQRLKIDDPDRFAISLLTGAVQSLAAVHATGPSSFAKPPLTPEGYLGHMAKRLHKSPDDERAIILAGITPIARQLGDAHCVYVKDGNPKNCSIFIPPSELAEIAKAPDAQIHHVEAQARLFDYEVALLAPPFYDYVKLLEHNQWLSRAMADELMHTGAARYNELLAQQGKALAHINPDRKPITDWGRFNTDRECWRILQFLSNYHHPNYQAAKYWPNKAFWMERAAETIDILLTQHASRFDANERKDIAALKPVFETYHSIAQERANEGV